MTRSFPATRRAVMAGAVGAAFAAPIIKKGAFVFSSAPVRSFSRRTVDLGAEAIASPIRPRAVSITLGAEF